MPKIIHYRKKCIGCNICFELWPLRWRISRKDGKCTLIDGIEKKGIWQVDISDNEYTDNLRVAKACPVKIIKLSI